MKGGELWLARKRSRSRYNCETSSILDKPRTMVPRLQLLWWNNTSTGKLPHMNVSWYWKEITWRRNLNWSHSFFDNLTRVTDLDSIPDKITVKQMWAKFMIWIEATSTSPSGRHLFHYKLLFQPIDPRLEKPDRQKFQEMQENIANMHCSMINYATTHRYSFWRWQHIENTIIYEPNNVKVHRLRVIHIIEADLNLLTWIKFRDSV